MSENQNRGSIDFEKYDSMATEELEEILRLDAEMPEGQESDTDKILYIMEVLTERKRNNSHTGNTALEAFESFKQNYMPETDDDVKAKRRNYRWIRSLTATAAVLAILLAGTVTAKAFGFNIWKAVVQWTQETFHFGDWGDSDPNNNRAYASLQEALEQGNVPAWLVPTYIPEGYSLKDIKVEQTPLKKIYKAEYIKKETILRITVQDYLDGDPVFVEQSEDLVEDYKALGTTYYLFENNKQVQAIWIVDSYECNISGNITVEELKTMINSIKKG